MAESSKDDRLPLPEFDDPPKLLIVAAPFTKSVVDDLAVGARAILAQASAAHETIEVPGALEIPAAIKLAAVSDDFDGYVALGCVIRGETTHYDTVCRESAHGLTLLGLAGFCVGNGILTVENLGQAEARANPAGLDSGGGAAAAALHLVALSRKFRSSPKGIGFRFGAPPGVADSP